MKDGRILGQPKRSRKTENSKIVETNMKNIKDASTVEKVHTGKTSQGREKVASVKKVCEYEEATTWLSACLQA